MRLILAALVALAICPSFSQVTGEEPKPAVALPATDLAPQDYICPMDKDVRASVPGTCPRCGMKLVLGIPDDLDYLLEIKTNPAALRPGQKTHLTLSRNPKTGATATKFEIMHEKLFHLFILSSDLSYFLHDHPVPMPDGTFQIDTVFPKSGMYRIVGDTYPSGATPQLIAKTLFVLGDPKEPVSLAEPHLEPDLGIQHGTNLDAELVMEPPQPIVGMKTLLFVRVKPADHLEKWLGAWAHMLAVSDDTIDMIHDHPFIADGGPQLQFNIIFPRAHTYKVFVQIQREGKVNTFAFTVPVSELK